MRNESWNDTQRILAFFLVASFILVIILWMFHPPSGDAGTTAVLNTLVGALAGMAGMVATFYFGSSRGSQSKDDTIQNMAATAVGDGHAAAPAPSVAAPSGGAS